MKKIHVLALILFSFSSFISKSQDIALDSLLDAVILGDDQLNWLFEEDNSYHFVYARSAFSNNTQYAGREIGDQMINLRSDLMYFNSKGFFGGISGALYSQLDPKFSSTSISVGYGMNFKKLKIVRWRISADKYFFTDKEYEPIYMGSLSIGTSIKHKFVGLRTDYSILFGKEFSSQLSLSAYTRFNLLKFGENNKIQVRPTATFLIAPETVEIETIISNPRFPDIPVYSEQSVTGLLNVQLSVPLTVYINNLDVQLTYKYNLPLSLDPLYSYPNSSQWNLSVGYLFNSIK